MSRSLQPSQCEDPFISSDSQSIGMNSELEQFQRDLFQNMGDYIADGKNFLDVRDLLGNKEINSTNNSTSLLPIFTQQSIQPIIPSQLAIHPPMMDTTFNQFFDESGAEPEEEPKITHEMLEERGRKRPKPKRMDYNKNISKNIVHKIAKEIQKDPNAQKVIKRKLFLKGINQLQFQILMKEIIRRDDISNRDLLWIYLVPREEDTRRQLKEIFSEYFMFYLENYFAIASEESDQIQKLLTYISYSRKYLAYLSQYGRHCRAL